jgi:hypothetical protein
MTSPPHMRGLIELDGGTSDLDRVRLVALVCDCAIEPGPDARLSWLGGSKIEQAATPDAAKEAATELLVILNSLARIQNPKHRNVGLGSLFIKGGQTHFFGPPRPYNPYGTFMHGSFLGGPTPRPHDPVGDRRRAGLMADPKLIEIVKVFGEEISWQKLRFAFELINALVGKGDNALVKNKYATQAELKRFKENIEDSRHSGTSAVHSVAKGRLEHAKMTEEEGLAFVVRLLDTYLDKHP